MKKSEIERECEFMTGEAWRARRFVLLRGPRRASATALARKMAARSSCWVGARSVAPVWRCAGLSSERTRGPLVAGEEPGPEFSEVFRAPHHSVSLAGMTGMVLDGWCPRPGELSLAHGGTLFLDELPEFRADVLGKVLHAIRFGWVALPLQIDALPSLRLPAAFSLVASAPWCPCGVRGSRDERPCACTDRQVAAWNARIAAFVELCEEVRLPEEPGSSLLEAREPFAVRSASDELDRQVDEALDAVRVSDAMTDDQPIDRSLEFLSRFRERCERWHEELAHEASKRNASALPDPFPRRPSAALGSLFEGKRGPS